MRLCGNRMRLMALLPTVAVIGACPSSPGPFEAFHFQYHVEAQSGNSVGYASQCTKNEDGSITGVSQRDTAPLNEIEAALRNGDAVLAECAVRWVARFSSATNSVSKVEITSGDRSRTSSNLTTVLQLGGIANQQPEWFTVSGAGRLTAVTIIANGAVRSGGGSPVWLPCTAQFSFQEDLSSNPRSVFEAGGTTACQIRYSIFDDDANDAGGQFRLIAENVEDTNDTRLLIIPDGAFSLNLD